MGWVKISTSHLVFWMFERTVLAWASLWLLSFPVNYWFTSQEVPFWPSFFAWRPQFSPQPDLRPTPTCFLHPLTNNIFFAHPSDNNICIHRTTIFFSPIQQTTIFASIDQQYLFHPSIRQQYLHLLTNNIIFAHPSENNIWSIDQQYLAQHWWTITQQYFHPSDSNIVSHGILYTSL